MKSQFSENDYLPHLSQISNALVGSNDPRKTVVNFLKQICSILDVDAAIVRTYQDRFLHLYASIGIEESLLAGRLPVDQGIAKAINSDLKPITIQKADQDSITSSLHKRAIDKKQIFVFQSYAGSPMLIAGRFVGVLGIYTIERVRSFSQTDLNVLQLLANQLGITIENERLYDELKSLTSLGRGVVHDVKNYLAAGITASSMLEILDESEKKEACQHIGEALQRGLNLCHNFLELQNTTLSEACEISLNLHLENILPMIKHLVSQKAEVRLSFGRDLYPIYLSPENLDRIILNIVANARDACGETGLIDIETLKGSERLEHELDGQKLPSGSFTAIKITDNGVGMEREQIASLMKENVTTKPRGEGYGVGLSTVSELIRKSGGHLFISSRRNRGTTVLLLFPTMEKAVEVD